MKHLIMGAILIFASIIGYAQQPQTQLAPLFSVNARYTNGVAPGYYPTAGAGLVLNVGPGTVYCTLGSVLNYAGGTLTLTDNSTNYVYLNGASSCVPAFNTSGFTTSQVPIAIVTTASGAITNISDDRTIFSNVVTTSPGSGCPTTGCTYTGPVILAADPTTALQAVTKQYADAHPFLDPLGFGCVPNSTVAGDMTATTSCLSTMLNTFGRVQLPAGTWNINSCINVSNTGGIIFEGAGEPATSLVQNTDNVCGIQFTGFNSNEIVVRYMATSHKNVQTAGPAQTSNSAAPFISINGSAGNAFFRFDFDHLSFANSSRGIELSKSAGQTVWAYNLTNLTATSTLQGALVNFIQGGSGGNPRPYMHQLFCTQVVVNEPCISLSNGFELHLDGIEVTPVGTPAASFLPVIDVTGANDGTVENVHIENLHVGAAGNRLIAEENSHIINRNVSASLNICPSPDACSGSSGNPDVSFISNVAGGGTVSATNIAMFLYGTSNTSSTLYGVKYGTNPLEVSCDDFATVGLGSGTASCIYPSSDLGRATRNGPQYSVIASASTSALWNITAVATSSGGAAVYAGTFTGCTTGAIQRTLISGFVATPANNGYYRVKSCTASTLTLFNSGSVSETHAATATVGVDGVGIPFYGRWWNGSTQLTICTPNVLPTYNPVTGLWDTYFSTFCTGTQTNSQSYSNPMGWFQEFTAPGSNNTDITTGKLGLSGVWTQGGLVDSNGAIPVLRGSRNVGGVVVDTDFRASADGGGNALGEICPSVTAAGAFGTLTAQTDQQCPFMVNRLGDWYNQNGLTNPIVPHTVTAFEGGATGVKLLGCTGTFNNGNLLKFDVNGACTDSGISAATITPVANIQITTNTTAVPATTCTTNTASTMTGLTVTSAIIPPTPTSSTAAVTGWGATGGLSFTYYVTANTFNWSVCNTTSGSITPGGSVTWNVGAR